MNKKILLYLSMSTCAIGLYMHTRSRQSTPKNIWQAAAQGNLAAVKNFVEVQKVDVNSVDDEKRTPLILATDNEQLKVMNYLIQNKADVNMQDEYGETALMHAAKEGLHSMVRALIARNVNVNAVNKQSETALMEAADEGHPESVKHLLDNAANANMVDNDKETALVKAINEYDKEENQSIDIKTRYMKVIKLLVPKTNSDNLKKASQATRNNQIKSVIQKELDQR